MRIVLALAALVLASPAVALEQSQPPAFTMPFVQSVVGSGLPGLQARPAFLWNGFGGSTFDSNATLRVDRDVETTSGGGKPWYTYKAFWALGTTSYVSPGFEWTITGELNNRTRKSAGAQNVAVNGTAWKLKTDNGEETGTTWAGNFNCVDTTGVTDPSTSCVGAEVNVGGAVGTDAYRQRVAIHAAIGGQPGSHVGYGVMVSATDGTTVDRAFSVANVGSRFGIGLDLAGGVFGGPAIALAPRQWLAFDADANGKFGRFLGFDSGDGLFKYMTPYGPMLTFSDDGAAKVGRLIQAIPHVPASKNAPCEPGEQAWDASFIYVCIAPSRWRRAALSDW